MECVGNRFRPHMMYIVYHIILDMSIFVEACKKIAKISARNRNVDWLQVKIAEIKKDKKKLERKK